MNRNELRKELLQKLNTISEPYLYEHTDVGMESYNFQVNAIEKLTTFAPLLLSEKEKEGVWDLIFNQYYSPKLALIVILTKSLHDT